MARWRMNLSRRHSINIITNARCWRIAARAAHRRRAARWRIGARSRGTANNNISANGGMVGERYHGVRAACGGAGIERRLSRIASALRLAQRRRCLPAFSRQQHNNACAASGADVGDVLAPLALSRSIAFC
jgi:hypothetical protein